MSNIVDLPTAAASYYTVRRMKGFYEVVIVTPVHGHLIKTPVSRHTDLQLAIAHGRSTADRLQRPFKMKVARA